MTAPFPFRAIIVAVGLLSSLSGNYHVDAPPTSALYNVDKPPAFAKKIETAEPRQAVPVTPAPTSSPLQGPQPFLAEQDWTQFVPGLVATFIGSVSGIGVAFWRERTKRRREDHEASETMRRANLEVIRRIREELLRAIDLMEEMNDGLRSGVNIASRPVTDVWLSSANKVVATANTPAIPLAYEKIKQISILADLYDYRVTSKTEYAQAKKTLLPKLLDTLESALSACKAAEVECSEAEARLSDVV